MTPRFTKKIRQDLQRKFAKIHKDRILVKFIKKSLKMEKSIFKMLKGKFVLVDDDGNNVKANFNVQIF